MLDQFSAITKFLPQIFPAYINMFMQVAMWAVVVQSMESFIQLEKLLFVRLNHLKPLQPEMF